MAAVKAGQNAKNAPMRVQWSGLQRANESSCRSWCPVCDQGLLLVRRFPADLSQFVCWDSCTMCGQPFMYLDEEIRGTHVLSSKELEVAWVQES